eukprot:202230_1
MSTSEVTCSNPYLDPILYVVSTIAFAVGIFIMHQSVIKTRSAIKPLNTFFKNGLMLNNISCIIIAIMFFIARLLSCSDPIGAYIATSIRVIVYMIQILAQLTLFRARFYQAFKGSALAVSNTKQKMLTIFISILIFLLLFGYILLMIYFATNISSSLLMIAMSQTRTPSETSMETKENSSKENSSKINTVTIQTSIDFDVATADKENGNIGGAKMKNVSSVKQIELVKILGVTSRIFLLSVIGLLSTSLISVIQLILTNMSSGYILTRISDGLMVIDSLIGCICVYLTFDFAQAHFEKCIICSYCSFLCNKIIVNKRQKQIKNQQENKTVESN